MAEAEANITVAISEYLAVRQAVDRGIGDADDGRVVSHDEARGRLGL